MSIIQQLASSLNRRDEEPNIDLAKKIAGKNDVKAVEELIQLLRDKNKNIQSDAIKVLDEITRLKPGLAAKNTNIFLQLLTDKNNRLQWGAMAVLDNICMAAPETVYQSLPAIMDAAEKGSVITRDRAVNILIQLCSNAKWNEHAFVLLKEQLNHCPTNQLPMYAENCMAVLTTKQKPEFVKILSGRLNEFEKESKRKRVEKIIKKLLA